MKELHEVKWEELVANSCQEVHLALLEDGGRGMRGAIHSALDRAIRWSRAIAEQEKVKEEKTKKRKK